MTFIRAIGLIAAFALSFVMSVTPDAAAQDIGGTWKGSYYYNDRAPRKIAPPSGSVRVSCMTN
jgi:hypothetical protein